MKLISVVPSMLLGSPITRASPISLSCYSKPLPLFKAFNLLWDDLVSTLGTSSYQEWLLSFSHPFAHKPTCICIHSFLSLSLAKDSFPRKGNSIHWHNGALVHWCSPPCLLRKFALSIMSFSYLQSSIGYSPQHKNMSIPLI